MSQLSELIKELLTTTPQLAEEVYETFKGKYPNLDISYEDFSLAATEYTCPQVEGLPSFLKIKEGVVPLPVSSSEKAALAALKNNQTIKPSNKLKR